MKRKKDYTNTTKDKKMHVSTNKISYNYSQENLESKISYAEHYRREHLESYGNFDYKLGYTYLILMDSMLQNYRLLDVGCGTAGAYRLCSNYNEIIGVDYSSEMIDVAKRFAFEFNYDRIFFKCERFEDFEDNKDFDVISLVGTYGMYCPWPTSEYALVKSWKLLSPGGICIVSVRYPSNIIQWVKAIIFPKKTTVISERKFKAICNKSGFIKLFSICFDGKSYCFLQKN